MGVEQNPHPNLATQVSYNSQPRLTGLYVDFAVCGNISIKNNKKRGLIISVYFSPRGARIVNSFKCMGLVVFIKHVAVCTQIVVIGAVQTAPSHSLNVFLAAVLVTALNAIVFNACRNKTKLVIQWNLI